MSQHALLLKVHAESQAPDLWGAAAADRSLAAATASDRGNDAFSALEIRAVEEKIDEITAYIQQTHARDDVAKEFIDRRMSYLKTAAGRLGRIDWLNIVVGQLVSIAVSGAINSSALGDVMRFAGMALQTVVAAVRTATQFLS